MRLRLTSPASTTDFFIVIMPDDPSGTSISSRSWPPSTLKTHHLVFPSRRQVASSVLPSPFLNRIQLLQSQRAQNYLHSIQFFSYLSLNPYCFAYQSKDRLLVDSSCPNNSLVISTAIYMVRITSQIYTACLKSVFPCSELIISPFHFYIIGRQHLNFLFLIDDLILLRLK